MTPTTRAAALAMSLVFTIGGARAARADDAPAPGTRQPGTATPRLRAAKLQTDGAREVGHRVSCPVRRRDRGDGERRGARACGQAEPATADVRVAAPGS